uniref:TOG domain-containing protein n=1 Tax=Physcomitrium patens TaxID=3218 RepID=UPI0022EC9ACB
GSHMLWSQAMESVRASDFDLAYADILGSNDELLLVRLMSRTGPVLEQLSDATLTHLMGNLKHFLQQQSFLECVIPWIQQVADLVLSNGPNALGLTGDSKKDLVFALQEAASMDHAQSWMAAKIVELAEQLRSAWL